MNNITFFIISNLKAGLHSTGYGETSHGASRSKGDAHDVNRGYRGDGSYRGSGAIRRGGRRGS